MGLVETSVIPSIVNLPQKFGDTFSEILKDLFIPSDDFIEDKVNQIKSKFSFAYSTIEIIESIQANIQNAETEPPVITMNFGNAKSKYNWGGTAYALNFDWYAEYKPFVDSILSGIMWLLFVWRVFVRLPSIINGGSSAVSDSIKISNFNK